MSKSFMTNSHRNSGPFVWPLDDRQALTLAADPGTRALWVHEGEVWLTRACSNCTPDDIWLGAGQSHTLPAGTEWVVEGWPQARFSVVQAAPAVIKPRGWASWLPWRSAAASAWMRA